MRHCDNERRWKRRVSRSIDTSVFGRLRRRAFVLVALLSIAGVHPDECEAGSRPGSADPADCAHFSNDEIKTAINAAVAAGEISDPTKKVLPNVGPRTLGGGAVMLGGGGVAAVGGGVPIMTTDDLIFFEDTGGLLQTNFSDGALFNLMADATNVVLSNSGDNFDFVAFWVNFFPNHQLGAAFYLGLENNVSGIGSGSFNFRPGLGVGGVNVEGWVMMWRPESWPTGPDNFTQLVLGQEFEHRFGMRLSGLPGGGRPLQGDDGACGRSAHWNFRVDGQGSGMEIAEWVGSTPASLLGTLRINSDTAGVFSFPDLYLMGYVSPGELDLLPSELRYMDNNTNCSSPYSGPISNWTSSDLEATNGVRSPNSSIAQKSFRTAWVMIHLPGIPPSLAQQNRVVSILNTWSETWESSTLGRGTMDNTLLGVPFRLEIVGGVPDFLVPDVSNTVTIQATLVGVQPDTTSGVLHFSVDGGPESTVPLTFISGNDFQATFPPMTCPSVVSFFVTMDSIAGTTSQFPVGPVGTTATTVVAFGNTVLLDDNFETDMGWTVVDDPGLTDGSWDRGIPIGGGDRGDPPVDFDGSGQCYLTDNVDGNSDVDLGATMLVSPMFALGSAPEALFEYARWYTNDSGSNPGTDNWVVEVTNNGIDWVEMENTTASSGWLQMAFGLADFVTLTDQVQVRFVASDFGLGAFVEAGVDAVKLSSFLCVLPPCPATAPPAFEAPAVAKGRFLSFAGGNPGAQTAIRVKLLNLPAPFDVLNGQTRWVGAPIDVSENGGSIAPVTGFANFKAAGLGCTPFYTDWSLEGVVHVFDERIVPGAVYALQEINEVCDPQFEPQFSAAIPASTAAWGDVSGAFDVGSGLWLPPDTVVDITSDVVAILAKFSSKSTAPAKSRVDLQPATPDLIIDIGDVVKALDAFGGKAYEFPVPTDVCP